MTKWNRETVTALFKQAGLSRAKFAKAVGVSKPTVDTWLAPPEANIASTPSLMAAEKLDKYEKKLNRQLQKIGESNDNTGTGGTLS